MISRIHKTFLCTQLALLFCSHAPAMDLRVIEHFGTSLWDSAEAVALDRHNNIFVAGFSGTLSPSNSDVYLRKYSDSGRLLWERAFGTSSEAVWRLETDALGNVFVGGLTGGDLTALNADGADAFVTKYDAYGQHQWTRQYGTADNEAAYGLAVATNGDLLVASGFDVRKYDQAGNLIWDKPLVRATGNYEVANAIAVDDLGNVFVGGRRAGDARPDDLYITRFDLDGNRSWTEYPAPAWGDVRIDLTVDDLGNAFLLGPTPDAAGQDLGRTDVVVAKYSASGSRTWIRQFGGTLSDHGSGIASDYHGGIFVAGWTNSGSNLGGAPLGSQDAYVLQFDAGGSMTWSQRLGTARPDTAHDLATNASGRLVVVGKSSGDILHANRGIADAWIASNAPAVPEPGTGILAVMAAIACMAACRAHQRNSAPCPNRPT